MARPGLSHPLVRLPVAIPRHRHPAAVRRHRHPAAVPRQVDAPSQIEGSYQFGPAAFGPPLPESRLTTCLVYVGNACGPVPPISAGCVALVDRGAGTEAPSSCPLPNAFFANKVLQAQQAGASAVIVTNNRFSPYVVTMAAVSGDHAADVTIPSVFVTQARARCDSYAGGR